MTTSVRSPMPLELLGGSPIQKYIAAVQMLAYGVSADFLDDYIRLGESTIIECLKHFVKSVVLNDFLKIHEEIEDRSSHERLRDDLVEHLWARYSAR